MTRPVHKFDGFAEADAANREYYASLTPEERLSLVFEISRRHCEANGQSDEGLARVFRVVDLARAGNTSADESDSSAAAHR